MDCGELAKVTTASGDGFPPDSLLQLPSPLLLGDAFHQDCSSNVSDLQ